MNDEATRKTLIVGWALLALFVPLGLTLEALHALKLPVYLDSVMRREMWTLAHAHGNLLGILCVAFAAVAKRTIPDEVARASIARWLRWGHVVAPLAVTAGHGPRQRAALIPQADGHAVDLRIADVRGAGVRAQPLDDAIVPGAEVLDRVGVVDRLHGERVGDGPEGVDRLAAHPP